MDHYGRAETIGDKKFRLLSVASLMNKIKSGITLEDLYRDAERKFDTLIEILSDVRMNNNVISTYGYTVDELKEVSLLTFNRLISDRNSNSYMILCVQEGASLEEVRRRRNRLLHIYHPDRSWTDFTDSSKARKINEAYEHIAKKFSERDMARHNKKSNIPPYYYYKKRYHDMRIVLFLAVVIMLLAFLGFMKKGNFF